MTSVAAAGWPGGFALARARQAVRAPAGANAAPLVAILCTPPRARVAACALALASARALGRPCALAGAVGGGPTASLVGTPSAHRAGRALHERGLPATASGRLVWLADRRGTPTDGETASRAAALSADLGRAVAAVGAPAAVAFPFARTPALDRVLAWHDAIVVVREPDAPNVVIDHALRSLAALDRPVAVMAVASRFDAVLATSGLRAPAGATDAVAALGWGWSGG